MKSIYFFKSQKKQGKTKREREEDQVKDQVRKTNYKYIFFFFVNFMKSV